MIDKSVRLQVLDAALQALAAPEEVTRLLHTLLERNRVVVLPALAASSPIIEGKISPQLDTRLEVYRHNCAKIPSVTGLVIPELAQSKAEYEREIFQRIYRDLAPHDPERILQDEWVNARCSRS